MHGESLEPVTGLRDIDWLRPDGHRMTEEDWHEPAARSLGMLLSATVPGTPAQADLLLSGHWGGYPANHEQLTFRLGADSVNLYALVRAGLMPEENLLCPGDDAKFQTRDGEPAQYDYE